MCPSMMFIMDGWRVADAKQRFSEVVRRSLAEPQKIYNRDRLVAAVVSPEALAALERVRHRQAARMLADVFAEMRAACGGDGYELDIPERRDRPAWPVDES